MTWAQANGWLNQMTAYMQQRAAERAYLTPGSGVEINGGVIALDAPFREEPEAAPEPTWVIKIYGRYPDFVTGSGQAVSDEWALAATLTRAGALLPTSFLETATFFSNQPEEGEEGVPVDRYFTLELSSRSGEPTETLPFEDAPYRVPVRVVVSVWHYANGSGGERIEDREEIFLLNRSSQSRSFIAERPNITYNLTIKSITQL